MTQLCFIFIAPSVSAVVALGTTEAAAAAASTDGDPGGTYVAQQWWGW